MFASSFLLDQVGLCCVTFSWEIERKTYSSWGGGRGADRPRKEFHPSPAWWTIEFIGATYRWMGDSKAVTSPGSLLGNLWATKSLICSMDDSLRPAPLRSSSGHLWAAAVKEESLFPVNFPCTVQPGEQWGLWGTHEGSWICTSLSWGNINRPGPMSLLWVITADSGQQRSCLS